MTRRILLAGSTGLIGRRVAARLAEKRDVRLHSLVRSGSAEGSHVVDFERLCDKPDVVLRSIIPDGIDVAISCLGTTIRQAGSQPAMFRVDHDYVAAVARGARALSARHFILVTAAGAGGPGFYLRTKGAVERTIAGLEFERIDLIRPGFLLGARAERRTWEAIAQRVFAALNPLLPGPLSRYGAIPADTVADAIVALTEASAPACGSHENADMRALAGR